jgi:hypothetical protein
MKKGKRLRTDGGGLTGVQIFIRKRKIGVDE